MPQRRRDLRQGREDEAAFVQPRVGQRQAWVLQDQIVEKEQVQVDRPRRVGAVGPAAAESGFDGHQARQQLPRAERGGQPGGGVEVIAGVRRAAN